MGLGNFLKTKIPSAFEKIFKETEGGVFRQGAATIGNVLFNKVADTGFMSYLKAASPGLAGAVTGAAGSWVGSKLFPDSVEYNGFLSPALKGAMVGIGVKGVGSVLGHPNTLTKMPNMTKPFTAISNFSNSKTAAGIIGAGAFMGTGEVSFTQPLNGLKDRY